MYAPTPGRDYKSSHISQHFRKVRDSLKKLFSRTHRMCEDGSFSCEALRMCVVIESHRLVILEESRSSISELTKKLVESIIFIYSNVDVAHCSKNLLWKVIHHSQSFNIHFWMFLETRWMKNMSKITERLKWQWTGCIE